MRLECGLRWLWRFRISCLDVTKSSLQCWIYMYEHICREPYLSKPSLLYVTIWIFFYQNNIIKFKVRQHPYNMDNIKIESSLKSSKSVRAYSVANVFSFTIVCNYGQWNIRFLFTGSLMLLRLYWSYNLVFVSLHRKNSSFRNATIFKFTGMRLPRLYIGHIITLSVLSYYCSATTKQKIEKWSRGYYWQCACYSLPSVPHMDTCYKVNPVKRTRYAFFF